MLCSYVRRRSVCVSEQQLDAVFLALFEVEVSMQKERLDREVKERMSE